jgi:hypothetical protein
MWRGSHESLSHQVRRPVPFRLKGVEPADRRRHEVATAILVRETKFTQENEMTESDHSMTRRTALSLIGSAAVATAIPFPLLADESRSASLR